MKPLPLPLRVAAGLTVITAERMRDLPRQLTGFPVTVASQVLQLSMRVQQQVTEIAIKGDDALANLRPVEQTPSWATFDEDLGPNRTPPSALGDVADSETSGDPLASNNGDRRGPRAHSVLGSDDDPWAQEEIALAADHQEGEFDSGDESTRAPVGSAPAGLANYDELTLPQLRARLRRLSVDDLEELLAYEREHADRASFTGMLARRIANVRSGPQPGRDSDATDR